MFDSDFLKAALKEYGAPVILLLAIAVLKSVGLLDFESLKAPLSMGPFFGGLILIVITIMTYCSTVTKAIRNNNRDSIHELSDDMQETKTKVNESYNLLNSHTTQSNQMHYLIVNMYELIKGIPNKSLIYETLIIRSKYLINESLEPVLEYIVSQATPLSPDSLIRIQNKLERSLTKLKVDYMESIVKISKSLLNNEDKAEIESYIEETISNIYGAITTKSIELADALFKVNVELKDLEDLLKSKFKVILDSNSDGIIDESII